MDFGICLQTLVPLRAEPSHKSEMVTQLLFGELFRVVSIEKGWISIRSAYDDYPGWMPANQVRLMGEQEFVHLMDAETAISLDLVQLVSNLSRNTIAPLIMGSSLPGFSGGEFTVLGDSYQYDGSATSETLFDKTFVRQDLLRSRHSIVSDALLYLNAPYLWGGRTPFGIDCSGLVQMVYKLRKIRLLRDASQQAAHGESVNFITESEPGDLAFFDNEEGSIIHVGILMDKSRIIHTSGKVRIDTIDHFGIFNSEENRYTHKLRLIKRIL